MVMRAWGEYVYACIPTCYQVSDTKPVMQVYMPKCTTFTPQIKGNNRAIYLIFPLHQGIIMILPGKVVPLNSLIYSLIYKPKWNYTLYIGASIRYRLWVLVLKFRQVSSRHF